MFCKHSLNKQKQDAYVRDVFFQTDWSFCGGQQYASCEILVRRLLHFQDRTLVSINNEISIPGWLNKKIP